MLEFLDMIYTPIKNYKSCNTYDSIFQQISESYYHENYHSDIIAYYLKNKTVLKEFINWINRKIKSEENQAVHYQDYEFGSIYRESDRIDIAIYSNDESRAIIIENKSNNAIDQIDQISRYYNKLKERNIVVEAIVYINKTSTKKPNLESSQTIFKQDITQILISTQLVGQDSFCENIIDKVLLSTNDIRLNGLSQEIKSLFHYVIFGGINMDDLDGFYNALKKNNNFEKMIACNKALNDIPVFLAKRYMDYLISYFPNLKIWLYKPDILVVDLIISDKKYAFDIVFHRNEVDVQFFNRDHNLSEITELINTIGPKFPFQERIEDRYHLSIANILDDDLIKTTLVSTIKIFI